MNTPTAVLLIVVAIGWFGALAFGSYNNAQVQIEKEHTLQIELKAQDDAVLLGKK